MTLTTHPVSSMIVVSIIEGKNFPVRHDKLLLVEAKFDGEVMSTDPIAHNTFPYFNTELAWEVDKKSLQMHRLQRTVIKLVFYAADTEQTRKESIGYIVLDMRVAQENSQKPTWLPLLNCKYHKEKPEVLINLFLEKESGQGGFSGTRGNTYGGGKTYTVNDFKPEKKNFAFNSIPRLAQKTPDSSLPQSSNTLKPVLLPESSFYRIGPPELCQENFIFSITLAFAANLNKLGPPPVSFRTSKDFYFYYSLFENGITTGRFANLSNPDFLAERASVKIWSSANLLSSYFEQHSNLELFLYCGDVRLALGHIPLGPLTSVNTHNINDEPISIDCSVQIYPIEKPCKFGNGELAPFVGICVVLQKVQELVTPDRPKVESREVVSNGAPVRRGNPFSRQTSVGSLHNGNEVNGNNIPHKDSSSVSSNNPRHTYTRAHSQEYEVSNERLNGTQTFTNSIHTLSRNTAAKVQFPASTGGNGQTGNNTRNGNGQMASDLPDNVPHHFCFSLDLSNFRATRLEHPVNVFIRYSYPFFGSTSSILSQPEIEVMPGSEVNIPNGFCAFNFSATFSLMKNTFCESPLILEVVHCKKQGSRQEQLVGTARINLFQILDTGTRPQTVEGKQATRRMCTCKVSVMSLDGREVGDIYAVLTLDDFGPSTSFYDKGPSKAKTPVLTQLRNSMSSFDVPSMKPNGYTQDELFQAAFELEVWKERQREVFRAELKEKEMQHLKVLVSEWKQRDTEREVLLQSRVQDCRKLEDKLKQTLQDAEIKEKQLAAQENELILRVQNIDKQQEQQEKEMKLQLDKMKTEYNDLIRIERVNFLDLEEKNSTLQRKIRDLESEMQEQRAVIESLQTQLHKRPDIQLKTEVNILRMEKTELRQKLQAMCSSKEKYKHQYSQALGQVAFYQQKLLVMEQLDRNRKAEELAAIQQRLLNEDSPESQKDGQLSKKTEERVTSSPHNSSPHSQGDGIDQESPVSQSASEPAPTSSKSKENEAEDSTKCTAFMKHLINQKEMLLRTGFKEDDQIMQRFNLKLGETKLASS